MLGVYLMTQQTIQFYGNVRFENTHRFSDEARFILNKYNEHLFPEFSTPELRILRLWGMKQDQLDLKKKYIDAFLLDESLEFLKKCQQLEFKSSQLKKFEEACAIGSIVCSTLGIVTGAFAIAVCSQPIVAPIIILGAAAVAIAILIAAHLHKSKQTKLINAEMEQVVVPDSLKEFIPQSKKKDAFFQPYEGKVDESYDKELVEQSTYCYG